MKAEQLKSNEDLVDVETFTENFSEFKIISIQRISEGSNSKVYQLQDSNKKKYAAKFYFRHQTDTRDRLETEFSSLSSLWAHGIRCIPQPLAIHKGIACALYEYIEGRKIPSLELTIDDIDESVQFLETLKALAGKSARTAFRLASEACFSFQDIVNNIGWRLKRLETPANKNDDLHFFLANDFKQFFEILVEWYKENSTIGDAEIVQEEKTLTPSDFGFHNALKKKDGSIVFFDFEYFGWDDPAKMISDFLLHPAMSLNKNMKERFVIQLRRSSVFLETEKILDRVKIFYPFFGLKWCLIFLNEFISDDLQRRNFAQKYLNNRRDAEQRQLLKAKKALATIKETYQDFPFDYAIR